MKRRLVGMLAVVVAIAAAIILYLQLRGRDVKGPDKVSVSRGGSGSAMVPATPKAQPEAPPQRPAQKWTLDTDPEGPLRLEGQVLGPDGKGVANALVAITTVPPRSVNADDDGTFSIDKLVARTYQLTASATDLVGGPVFYKPRDHGDPVVIHMSAGAGVDVTVVDDQSKPLSGATVKLGDSSERAAQTNAEGK
ncbi:MAG: carboxypeptidase regulatory-like domain-containing protein, partial [Kofleriaceae bacterium]